MKSRRWIAVLVSIAAMTLSACSSSDDSGTGSVACPSGSACEDMSGGQGLSYVCIPPDPQSLPACTDGPYGSGCPADQMCVAPTTSSETACISKKGDAPPVTCPNGNECIAPQKCVKGTTASYCVLTGCKAPSCPAGQSSLYLRDATTNEMTDCICTSTCRP